MPVRSCSSKGSSGNKWGQRGKCYTGKGSVEKAARQGRAIKANTKGK